ncbi:MAG: pilus assembly protein FimV [Gammaproteobacteria bacterium]|nr:pilus assembly protein FimV [Gammaproteobacteria bacterium]MBU1468060.1 pilus assembly protein FimV [Gammaproteobacteria bacterium]MBU2024164.1 pilus assembly protein FimV [Gammaproteobacteria bacterium]MBU2240802.1 pilus assembly protein FimV [Gammaproteobacteria bacterium]MBU2318436.1 pilus assembly protein FimV [Gammaproteobacteria bacterium]
MLRKTLVSIAVSGALYVSSSYALELGELTSQSNLGEPYRGKIELSDVGSLTNNDILIRLGSESEFRQAGFAQTRVLSQLRFDVVREGGNLVVAVSSDQPLRVDELHFILAARWPSGQVVREYQTPLNQSALVKKSQKEVVQSTPVASVTSASNQSVFRQATIDAEKMSPKGQLNVVKGNTLWSIAGQNRPTNQLTIYQTMMAIQALNKDAFYSDNINLLKEGAILRLPTQDQIALFNKSISKEEFQRQHDAWMALKGSKNSSAIEQAQLNTQAKAKAASNAPAAGGDKLTLASGQSLLPENAASSNAGDDKSAALNALQGELSASQEMLDKEQREKGELSTQLGDLNKQLETLEQLISLKDKQMADLQQQFASAQQALQEQKNTVDQLLEADQIRREKELAEENSLVNKIFGNPIVVSIGAVVLLLFGFLIGLVMRRAGKKQEEQDPLKKDEFDLSSAAVVAPVAVAAAANYALDDGIEEKEELKEEDPFAFDFDTPDEDDDLEDFGSFGDDIASVEFTDPMVDDKIDLSEDPEDELESAVEDDAIDDDMFASFDEPDDLSDPVLDFDEDDELDELETFVEDDIPTMIPEAVESVSDYVEDEVESEEESFVSSLLNDVDQDDVDESSIFSGAPNDSLANSIEETLAEAQQEEDEIEVPSFGEAEAAEDEEVSDEEEEFDFFDASGDEVATKLDLARAYMDMGDEEGARVILDDVIESGNEQQIAEAQNMMERMFPSD